MINYFEVRRIEYQFDESATPSENEYIRQHYACSRAELDALRYEFSCVNNALHLNLIIEDWIDSFVVRGDIEDDILYIFEDILGHYCNDDFDKVNYYYSEV